MKTFNKILFILGFAISMTISMNAINVLDDAFMSLIAALSGLTCLIGFVYLNQKNKA